VPEMIFIACSLLLGIEVGHFSFGNFLDLRSLDRSPATLPGSLEPFFSLAVF